MTNKTPYGWIYVIENTVNGKVYVGQTTRHPPEQRWEEHQKKLRLGCHTNSHLQNAVRKDGIEVFTFRLLASSETLELLNQCEVDTIAEYDSTNRHHGYNRQLGGSGGKHSEESRQKMSKSAKSRWKSPEQRERERERTHAYWSEDANRVKASKAQRQRFTEPEERQRIASAVRDRWTTTEYRERMVAGRKHQYLPLPPLLSPTGVEYRNCYGVVPFAREHGLRSGNLYHLITGKYKSTQGWTVIVETPNE